MAQRPFNEVINNIYAEYDAHAGLYHPATGIKVPSLDSPSYSVTASPLTGQVGMALRFSWGDHGDGGPVYTVKPDALVYNPGH